MFGDNPVYEMLFDFAVLAVIWRLRHRLRSDGVLFLIYVVLYGIGRFMLTYYRLERVWFWGLQEAQVLALSAVLVALPILVYQVIASSSAKHGPTPIQQSA